MSRYDSRAQRFARTWRSLCLAALVGIGGAGEAAAMPLSGQWAQLPGPTLIQQSTESPAQPPPGAPSADSFIELHQALTAARERLEELSKAAEAVAATRQLQQELAALRQENQELRAEIEAARAERGELETAKQAAEARAVELTKTVEQATAQAREMDQQLLAVAARWQNAQGNANRASTQSSGDQMDADARATQTALRSQADERDGGAAQTGAEAARLRAQIEASEQRVAAADSARTAAEAQLSKMRDSLQRAEQEKTSIGADLAKVKGELASVKASVRQVAAAGQERAQNAPLENERNTLRTRLADVTARLERSEAANARLESEIAELRGTPGAAADLARENLTETPTLPAGEEAAHLDERGILGGRPAVFTLADLPAERRQRVQGLLADLHSNLDERGLMTTVPGELLFAVGSDQVQADAYNTLAKVADLIGMYENRQVLIIGHSDSVGDADRNRQLSKRRADLVKQIFVENFDLPANRLTTEGAGETRPIASNTTSEGRRANRRVEVLILN